MQRKRRLACAVTGFGWWGQHLAHRLRDHPWLSITAIVESDSTKHADIEALGFAAYKNLSDALAAEDIGAVLIATPTQVHEEQVLLAAQAGKHVFCEKPLALSAASARNIVAACEHANVLLGIGHERRFEPAMLALKSDIDGGLLGTIMHAEAAFSHNKLNAIPAGNWRTMKALSPAAGMTATGIHLTDMLIGLFGRVSAVQAFTASRSLGWETGDVLSVQLAFEQGMTATLSAILDTPHFIRMHVFGNTSWVQVINESHPDTPGGLVQYNAREASGADSHRVFQWSDAVVANLEAFGGAALGDADYPIPTWQMIHNIELLEAIIKSADTRETVRL